MNECVNECLNEQIYGFFNIGGALSLISLSTESSP